MSNFFDVIKQLFSDDKNTSPSHAPGGAAATSPPAKHAQTPPNDSKTPPTGKDKTKTAAGNKTQERP